MTMKKLALATLIALGVSTVAIAQQQPSQRPGQPSAQPRSTQPTPAPRGGDRTEQVPFDRADENADGRLSRQEANEIEGFDFSRADTNNDQALSRQEYQAAMATSTQRDGGASARSGDAAGSQRGGSSARSGDADSDRQRSAGAADAQDRERGRDRDRDDRQAQVTFDTADKNKDGEISRDEARDVDGLNFTAADTDDDQSLSRQEFQVAMAGRQPRG